MVQPRVHIALCSKRRRSRGGQEGLGGKQTSPVVHQQDYVLGKCLGGKKLRTKHAGFPLGQNQTIQLPATVNNSSPSEDEHLHSGESGLTRNSYWSVKYSSRNKLEGRSSMLNISVDRCEDKDQKTEKSTQKSRVFFKTKKVPHVQNEQRRDNLSDKISRHHSEDTTQTKSK